MSVDTNLRELFGVDERPEAFDQVSITVASPEIIRSWSKGEVKNPETIKVSEDELTVERIKQLYVRVNTANRFGMLLSALRTLKPFLSLVFTRTKHDAKRLAKQLSFNGVSADAMHGNLRQNARERTMASFRNGGIDVLVATDLASRGIDVREITHVFNYDLPADPMTYVHRIGRTARAGADGVAISLVSGDPRRAVEIIERATGSKMEELVLTPEQAMMPHPDARPSNGPGRGRSSSHSSSRGHSSSSHPREHSEYRGHGEGRSNEERSSHRQGRSESHSSRSSGHSGERSEGGHSAHPDGPRRPTHHSSHKRY